jgi:hypothetical protein
MGETPIFEREPPAFYRGSPLFLPLDTGIKDEKSAITPDSGGFDYLIGVQGCVMSEKRLSALDASGGRRCTGLLPEW